MLLDAERMIDSGAEMDQSKLHVHVAGQVCPACDGNNARVSDDADADARSESFFERSTPPAILHYKIRQLENDLTNERRLRLAAERRIGQFERFTAMLSEYLDSLSSNSDSVQVNSKAA